MPRSLAALSLVLALAVLSGCKGDPKTPEYWDKQISGAHRADGRVRLPLSGGIRDSDLSGVRRASRA